MKPEFGLLYTVPVGFTGGAELRLLSLIDCIDRSKIEPVVVCGVGEQLPGLLKERGITHFIRPFRPRNQFNYWKNTAFLLKIIRKYHIRLIHGNSITSSIASAAAARISGRGFIADIRDFLRPSRVKQFLLNLADLLIVHSSAIRKHMINLGFPETKIRLIYNGFGQEWFEAAKPVEFNSSGVPVIGFLGQIAEIKGVPVLLKALKLLSGEFPDFRAVLVGDDFEQGGAYLEGMKRLAGALGIVENVHFAGFSDNPRGWLSRFDIAVMPSLEEPFGNSAVEALAQRKPLVAARTGGLEEIVSDGVTGLLVQPGSVAELAQAMAKLLRDPEWAKSLGEAGHQDTKRRFHLDRAMKELNEVYRGFLGNDVLR